MIVAIKLAYDAGHLIICFRFPLFSEKAKKDADAAKEAANAVKAEKRFRGAVFVFVALMLTCEAGH